MKFNIISIILQIAYGVIFAYNGFAIGVILAIVMIALLVYDIIEQRGRNKPNGRS